MIHFGLEAQEENARSLCKCWNNNTIAAGIVLTGYGTKPMPGCICDDGIQKVLDYATQRLQAVFDYVEQEQTQDMQAIAKLFEKQMGKINEGIIYFNRKVGQGAYLGGVVCLVIDTSFIILPFGGGCAYVWNGTELTRIQNPALANYNDGLIRDALGGAGRWPAKFTAGTLPIGSHLLCMTGEPNIEETTNAFMSLMQTDAKKLSTFFQRGLLETSATPAAVLDFYQSPDMAPEEVPV